MTRPMDAYAAEYEAHLGQHPGGPAWLSRARRQALDVFQSLGFPTTHDEEWRFTSVAPIAGQAFTLAGEESSAAAIDIGPFDLQGPAAARLVFVDGRYAPALSSAGSLPAGVRVESLRSVLAERPGEIEPHLMQLAAPSRQAFTALNTAFLADGACIQIAPRVVIAEPVHVLFLTTGGGIGRRIMAHPRMLVVAGAGSQASIVESYAGVNSVGGFTNAVTEVVLGENAVLDHYKLQHEDVDGYHVGSMHVRAARSANFSSHAISLGGSLVRNDVVAVLDGEGAECTLNGLYLAADRQLVDNHTTIDHAKPHCGSREIYKGILADHARGVFNGKIVVRPDAQKTDARQTNRALLLSEDAQINTKPQLEIFANDVKCTHGAAVGQLDAEALFYLRSRGLGAPEARRLLLRAFAADVLSHMRLDPARRRAEEALLRRLAVTLPAAA